VEDFYARKINRQIHNMKNSSMDKALLLVLDIKGGRLISMDPNGQNMKILVGKTGGCPDGIAVDPVNRHIYWTNMGEMPKVGEFFDQRDGTIERMDYDGSNRVTIIPKGTIMTPKQMQLDLKHKHIYWCDREGMRVMRANLDGSDITTLVITGEGDTERKDENRHCVGIALDVSNNFFYWTLKGPPNGGKGRILRAGLTLPPGADPADRDDIEVVFDNLPEPIDLEFNHLTGELYWTDRGDPPRGNSLNSALVGKKTPMEYTTLCTGLQEAIGLSVDPENDRVFFSDLGGNLYSARSDGSEFKKIYFEKTWFTGLVYVPGGLK
jgi:DNA-binding beta-propeller fold protein YncE